MLEAHLRARARGAPLALLVLALAPLWACAAVPYHFGAGSDSVRALPIGEVESRVERGRPHALLDGLGHYVFSLPSKLVLLSWKVDNHDISEETEAALEQYLEENGLDHVKVRLNQYDPGGEFDRLFRNQEIPAFWRYSIGALSVAAYTVFPNRLFGGDHYNPFTNTIHLFSDDRAIALHEAAHAKDFAGRRNKGSYAALRLLPIVPLYQEGVATGDAIGYERVRGAGEDEKRAYRRLYPAYGTYVGGEVAAWVPGTWLGTAIQYGAAVPGHMIGWIRSAFVEDRERPLLAPPEGEQETGALAELPTPDGAGAGAPDPPEMGDATPVSDRNPEMLLPRQAAEER